MDDRAVGHLQLITGLVGPALVLLGDLLVLVFLAEEPEVLEKLVATFLVVATEVDALYNLIGSVKQQKVRVCPRDALEHYIVVERQVAVDKLLDQRQLIQSSSGAALNASMHNHLIVNFWIFFLFPCRHSRNGKCGSY